jgi:hypothetical protein
MARRKVALARLGNCAVPANNGPCCRSVVSRTGLPSCEHEGKRATIELERKEQDKDREVVG